MTRQEVLHKAINTYGVNRQTDKCIEECAELIKALLKYRYASKTELNGAMGNVLRNAILEETADVQIMIDQMRMIYGDTSEQEEFKVNRLEKRMAAVNE